MAEMWRIVPQGQRLSTELSPAGAGFRDVWEVTYEVTDGPAKGTVGMVKIPADVYSADAVHEAVAAAVAHLHDVAGL
jgi:hypothetical protein